MLTRGYAAAGRTYLVTLMAATLLALLVVGLTLAKPAQATQQLVVNQNVTIPGNAPGDVDTGIDLQTGDRVVVSASGSFNPGCFLCGWTGPEGYTNIADNRFPLPGVREYSLLGKTNGSYFYIGTGKDWVHGSGPTRLFLRINDFLMSDNSGSYTANIQVFRDVAPPNTAPTVSSLRPVPGSTTHDRTPLIRATVSDAETNLGSGNISLQVDGQLKSFSYDPSTDRLTRPSNRLSYGRHQVQIVANDGQGLNTTRAWSFRIVR
ncbi:MAG TPA: hypothetical protein VF068_10860 [Rubrobacter sp.]